VLLDLEVTVDFAEDSNEQIKHHNQVDESSEQEQQRADNARIIIVQ